MSDPSISLNKFISEKGICSRREADRWIEEGRVRINNQIAKKGNRVFPEDTVTVDGKSLQKKPALIFIAFHKPAGITCTTDSRDPDNIIRFIGHKERIFPIGRLDKASTGLIFLTNEGDWVNAILRSENNHEKEYIVTVDAPIHSHFAEQMRNGVKILGQKTKACQVDILSKNSFRIILTQGLNRQIRRMCEALGYQVLTLKRIRIINILLNDLKVGQWRNLTTKEISNLEEIITGKTK